MLLPGFADYAEHVMPVLCPGGYAAPAIVTSGETATPKPQDLFPDGSAAAGRSVNSTPTGVYMRNCASHVTITSQAC